MGQGDSTDSGLLAVHRLDQVLDSETPTITFQLNASQVRVDTYQTDPVLVAGSAFVYPPLVGYQPDSRVFQEATVESSATKAGYRFSAVALNGGAPAHITSN